MSYGYDDNGNLTSRGSDSFAWDAADRLTSATVSSATTTFAYNGDGLRSSRNSTTFTWDVNLPIPQVIDDGTLKYVYGLGRIAQVGAGGTFYYLADGLGSTMALVNSAGAVVNSYEYDVFGAVRDSTGSEPNEFKFTGGKWETRQRGATLVNSQHGGRNRLTDCGQSPTVAPPSQIRDGPTDFFANLGSF